MSPFSLTFSLSGNVTAYLTLIPIIITDFFQFWSWHNVQQHRHHLQRWNGRLFCSQHHQLLRGAALTTQLHQGDHFHINPSWQLSDFIHKKCKTWLISHYTVHSRTSAHASRKMSSSKNLTSKRALRQVFFLSEASSPPLLWPHILNKSKKIFLLRNNYDKFNVKNQKHNRETCQ